MTNSKTYDVEVTWIDGLPIASACSPFKNKDQFSLPLELDESNWPPSMTEEQEARRVVDIALFALRLWKPGLFGIRRVAIEKRVINFCVRYYDRPYVTWSEKSPLERPLLAGEISNSTHEVQEIANLVNTIRNLENPILRRFGYFYLYPVGLDRLLILIMACDGLFFPDRLNDCESTRENFKQRMNHFVKIRQIQKLTKWPACGGIDFGDIYDARNGLSHGTVFSTKTKRKTPPIEACCHYLDNLLRIAIRESLTRDHLEDRFQRASDFRDDGFPCGQRGNLKRCWIKSWFSRMRRLIG